MKIYSISLSDHGNVNYVNNDITISFPLDDKLPHFKEPGIRYFRLRWLRS